MVCLSRPHSFKFFKDCLPQILLGPLLNTLSHLHSLLYVELELHLNFKLSISVEFIFFLIPKIPFWPHYLHFAESALYAKLISALKKALNCVMLRLLMSRKLILTSFSQTSSLTLQNLLTTS